MVVLVWAVSVVVFSRSPRPLDTLICVTSALILLPYQMRAISALSFTCGCVCVGFIVVVVSIGVVVVFCSSNTDPFVSVVSSFPSLISFPFLLSY